MKLKSTAKTWLKGKPDNEGLINWKRMLDRCDPVSGASKFMLQSRIVDVPRARSLANVPSLIEACQDRYQNYMKKVQKELDDDTREQIIMKVLPAATAQQVITCEDLGTQAMDIVHYQTGQPTPMAQSPLDEHEPRDGEDKEDEDADSVGAKNQGAG